MTPGPPVSAGQELTLLRPVAHRQAGERWQVACGTRFGSPGESWRGFGEGARAWWWWSRSPPDGRFSRSSGLWFEEVLGLPESGGVKPLQDRAGELEERLVDLGAFTAAPQAIELCRSAKSRWRTRLGGAAGAVLHAVPGVDMLDGRPRAGRNTCRGRSGDRQQEAGRLARADLASHRCGAQ